MSEALVGRERRLHLQAFDYWQHIKGDEEQPFFKDLTVEGLAPFKEQSLLVERTFLDGEAESDIRVRFFGSGLTALFRRRPTIGDNFRDFSDSGFAQELLSLLDNKSATDRAAEFEYVDLEVDSRGVMLPLSRTGETIDYLWVVISAKSYAELGRFEGAIDVDSSEVSPPEMPEGAFAAAHSDVGTESVLDVEEQPVSDPEQAPSPTSEPEPASMEQEDIDPLDIPVMDSEEERDDGDAFPEIEYRAEEADLSVSDGSVDTARPLDTIPGEIGLSLEQTRGAADDHISSTAPGYDRLYGLLADALKIYEESLLDPAPLSQALTAADLKTQQRAPFTPILKLIFGRDYDKTRLTEYGSAIAHAVRRGVRSEALPDFLRDYPGGIKGCVQAERMARRGDKTTTAHSRLKAAKRRLKEADAVALESVKLSGEFDLIMVRRSADKTAEILGRVDVSEPTMSALIEKQARRTRRSKPKV